MKFFFHYYKIWHHVYDLGAFSTKTVENSAKGKEENEWTVTAFSIHTETYVGYCEN